MRYTFEYISGWGDDREGNSKKKYKFIDAKTDEEALKHVEECLFDGYDVEGDATNYDGWRRPHQLIKDHTIIDIPKGIKNRVKVRVELAREINNLKDKIDSGERHIEELTQKIEEKTLERELESAKLILEKNKLALAEYENQRNRNPS